ncbi:MAG: flagellar biosynthetic protein FliO [Lachnospiraceae bacterium]|nr:flagellar biosynthetic protein FliO [Lachnospiraceae bacterium]
MLLSQYSSLNSFAELLTVLIIFIFVLVITYCCTRWMANYQKGKTFSRNIEVIETYKITTNKYIQIVRTGEKYLAIAVCKDTVTFLTELEKEQISVQEDPQGTLSGIPFKELLEKAKGLKK